MSDEEKIAFCTGMISDVSVTEAQITAYLAVAANKIMERLYPFGTSLAAMPSEYDLTQCELACRLIARRGGEGEISHSENGVSRTYGSVDDEDILQRITPYAGVI